VSVHSSVLRNSRAPLCLDVERALKGLTGCSAAGDMEGEEQSTWERAQYRPRSQDAVNRDALAAANQHTDSRRGGGGSCSRDLGLRRDFGRRPADSTLPQGLRDGTRWFVVEFVAHLVYYLQQAVFVDVSTVHGRMEAHPPGGPCRRAERPSWKHPPSKPPPCRSLAWALCLLVVVALLLFAGVRFVQRHVETVRVCAPYVRRTLRETQATCASARCF
jgi:hypothetical protein